MARDAAHRRLARAFFVLGFWIRSRTRATRPPMRCWLPFVEGEGGVASDAYALRWCLFHMKRSNDQSEAVAVACALSYVQKRSQGRRHCFICRDLDVL